MPDIFYLYEKDQGIGPRFIGELRKLSDDGEDYEFQYDTNAVKEIRTMLYRMPIREEPYGKDIVDKVIMDSVSPPRGSQNHAEMCEQDGIPLTDSRWSFLEKHWDFLQKVFPRTKAPLGIGVGTVRLYKERVSHERR